MSNKPTQLIINGVEYPYASNDRYQCYKERLGKEFDMISGRHVMEVRAKVTVIAYQYDYFPPELMRHCLADLRSDQLLVVQYLIPESNDLQKGNFHCTEWPKPKFAFTAGGKPYWHSIQFKLREVIEVNGR